MPVEWIDNLITEAATLGVTDIIPSTMGEPLLYSGIDVLFSSASRHGLKVNLTTNGSFPGKPIKQWAQQIIPTTRDIKISINGACKKTSESIMVGSDFDRQIENIEYLVSARNSEYAKSGWYCSITLQLTFMQSNINELADIVRLGCSLGVDRIKGHHLWTHFREITNLSMKASRESIETWNRCVEIARRVADENPINLPNGGKLRLENIIPLLLSPCAKIPDDYECPFLGKELWVSATGRISPCCCPDAERRTLGDFGRYPQMSLRGVLESPEYKALMENYRTMEVCKTCNMRKPVAARMVALPRVSIAIPSRNKRSAVIK